MHDTRKCQFCGGMWDKQPTHQICQCRKPLSEADIRRIVREELERAKTPEAPWFQIVGDLVPEKQP